MYMMRKVAYFFIFVVAIAAGVMVYKNGLDTISSVLLGLFCFLVILLLIFRPLLVKEISKTEGEGTSECCCKHKKDKKEKEEEDKEQE